MKKSIAVFFSFFLFFYSTQTLSASGYADADLLFNFVEGEVPEYFPPSQTSVVAGEWYYRYYESTGLIIAYRTTGDIYVYGDMFGGLVEVAPLQTLLMAITFL